MGKIDQTIETSKFALEVKVMLELESTRRNESGVILGLNGLHDK